MARMKKEAGKEEAEEGKAPATLRPVFLLPSSSVLSA
jgi:hypothetical protein